jgi:hypothetical protein
MRRAPTLLLALATLAGCPPLRADDTGGGVDCTTDARASIQLTVLDAAGAAVPDATATYSGGGFTDEPCEGVPGGVLVCGWEVAGPVDVHVSAPGKQDHDETIVVESDVCHVLTAQVEVVLEDATE